MNPIREYLRKAGTVFRRASHLHHVMSRWDVLRFLGLTFLGSHPLRFFCPPLGCAVTVRTRTTDLPVLEKIVLHREYEMPFDVKPETIIDAGANVGVAALYFARQFPRARIIAVEPEASPVLSGGKPGPHHPQITPVRGAIWNSSTSLAIAQPDTGKWAFRVEEPATATGNDVQAFTVPELMRTHHFPDVNLLKLDIEGAERELFDESAAGWLGQVGVLAIELHDTIKPGCGAALYARHARFRYEQRHIGENVFVRLLGVAEPT